MERVRGIGGVFLRSSDPEALRAWYAQHLGIPVEDWGGHHFVAESGDGTVWSLFPGDTDYWPREHQAMVNYCVADLDAMLAQLRAAGAPVDERVGSSSSAASAGRSTRKETASSSGNRSRSSAGSRPSRGG